jgi:hypothetical protein
MTSSRPNLSTAAHDQLLQVFDLTYVGLHADCLIAENHDLLFELFRWLGMSNEVDNDLGLLLG